MRDSDDDAPLVRTQFAGGPSRLEAGSQLMLGLTTEEVWWWKSHPMLWMRPQLQDFVDPVELDLRLFAFDPVDSDDDFDEFPRDVPGGVPVEATVESESVHATVEGSQCWPRTLTMTLIRVWLMTRI